MTLATDEDYVVWQIRQAFSKVADSGSERFISFPDDYDSEYILAALGKQLSFRHIKLTSANAIRNAQRAAALDNVSVETPLPMPQGFHRDEPTLSGGVGTTTAAAEGRTPPLPSATPRLGPNNVEVKSSTSINGSTGSSSHSAAPQIPLPPRPLVVQTKQTMGQPTSQQHGGKDEDAPATLANSLKYMSASNDSMTHENVKKDKQVEIAKVEETTKQQHRRSNLIIDDEHQKMVFANIASTSIMTNKPILGKDFGVNEISELEEPEATIPEQEDDIQSPEDAETMDDSNGGDKASESSASLGQGKTDKVAFARRKVRRNSGNISLSTENINDKQETSPENATHKSKVATDGYEDDSYYHKVFEEAEIEAVEEENKKAAGVKGRTRVLIDDTRTSEASGRDDSVSPVKNRINSLQKPIDGKVTGASDTPRQKAVTGTTETSTPATVAVVQPVAKVAPVVSKPQPADVAAKVAQPVEQKAKETKPALGKAERINSTSTLVIKKQPIGRQLSPTKQVAPVGKDKRIEEVLFGDRSSILSNLLITRSDTDNPLKKYSRTYGRKDPHSLTFNMYLPWSSTPKTPLSINVQPEATVEDVIGYALYMYNSEKLLPILPEELWNVAMWSLRIVEEDFEIDEDFPALERMRQIKRFSFDSFALCELQPGSVKRAVEAYLAKSPPPITASGIKSPVMQSSSANHDGIAESTTSMSPPEARSVALSPVSSSVGHGQNVFLKVHLYSTIEVKQTTTFLAQANQKMSEVFENICKKHKYDSSKYVMKMPDIKTDVPMDMALESLNITEFCILKRAGGGAGDIFLRPTEESESIGGEPRGSGKFMEPEEYSTMYKQYIVTQRTFMRVQTRQLTIDGDYIHLLTGHDTKNFFDATKASSYHASAVSSCQVLKQGGTAFRLVVMGTKVDDKTKSYDFEAATPSDASEICNRITLLLQFNKATTS